MNNGIYSQKANTADVKYLKGVGPARAALLGKLGIRTVGDLLAFFPRDYTDFSKGTSFSCCQDGEVCAVFATVTSPVMTVPTRNRGLKLYRVRVTDDNGTVGTVLFFNTEYAATALNQDARYCFIGKVDHTGGRWEISSPKYQSTDENVTPLSPV